MSSDRTVYDSSVRDDDLSRLAVGGSVWVFSLNIITRLLDLFRLLILARILVPEDFGLLGIAVLMIGTLDFFTQTGFDVALIQKKVAIAPYLDVAWTISVLRGVALFATAYMIAPYVAIFFGAPTAALILQVISLSLLLHAFKNSGIIYFRKELEFKKQVFFELTGTLVSFVVAIAFALTLKNVWALALSVLAGSATSVIMSYVVHPYRPHLHLDFGKSRELFRFGKWFWSANASVFLSTNIDNMFVGRLLGPTSLGFYQTGFTIANMPATEVSHVLSQVTMPVYSKLQGDISKLKEAYLKVTQLDTFFSFLAAGLIFTLAADFTKIFLGDKWMPMVPAITVLVFAGLVYSIASTTAPIFYAVGEPKIDAKGSVVRLFTLIALIYPFTVWWGIVGTSFAVFTSVFILTIVFCFKCIQIIKCEIRRFAKIIVLPLANLIVLISSLSILKNVININGVFGFFAVACIGLLIYFGIACIFDMQLDYNMTSLIKEYLTQVIYVDGKIKEH